MIKRGPSDVGIDAAGPNAAATLPFTAFHRGTALRPRRTGGDARQICNTGLLTAGRCNRAIGDVAGENRRGEAALHRPRYVQRHLRQPRVLGAAAGEGKT